MGKLGSCVNPPESYFNHRNKPPTAVVYLYNLPKWKAVVKLGRLIIVPKGKF